MEIFDYTTVVDNVAKGGRLKTNFLATDKEARVLDFQSRPMNDLVKELRATFSIRYVEPPSDDARAHYENMKRNPDVLPDALLYHPAGVYEAHKEKLQERGWLVTTMEKYLDDPIWPETDAAQLNMTNAKDKKRKRKEEESKKVNTGNPKRLK